MSKHPFLWASLVGLPLVSHAQTATPRFYLGAGANLLTNAPFSAAGIPRLLGPSVTAGKQLSAKLALQVGLSYFWQNETTSYSYLTYDASGQTRLINNSYSTNSKYLLLPVLLRYTFTAAPNRFYFDGLGGITAIYAHHHYTNTTDYAGVPFSNENNYSAGRVNLTIGPAVRYALSPTVELTANGLVSATIGDSYRRFSDRLFLNVLVGAHYTFGQRS
jgi:hypothetical protein